LAIAFFAVVFNSLRNTFAPYRLSELTSEEIQKLSEVFPNPDKEFSKVIRKNKEPAAYLIFTKTENLLIASPKMIEENYKDVGPIIRDTLFDTAANLDQDVVIKTKDIDIFRNMGFITYKNPNVLIAPCPKTLMNILNRRFEKGFANYISLFAKKHMSKHEIRKMKKDIVNKVHRENRDNMKILYKELLYRNAFNGITRAQTEDKFYEFIKNTTENSFEKSISSLFKRA
jgi:hypothetical protein